VDNHPLKDETLRERAAAVAALAAFTFTMLLLLLRLLRKPLFLYLI